MTWERWRGEIAKAADGSHHTIDSIEADLSAGRTTLLLAENCCFIAEIADYPAERSCQVLWAAGGLANILAALDDLNAWARRHGCSEILVEGHAGWARALKSHGYRPWSVTVRKAL